MIRNRTTENYVPHQNTWNQAIKKEIPEEPEEHLSFIDTMISKRSAREEKKTDRDMPISVDDVDIEPKRSLTKKKKLNIDVQAPISSRSKGSDSSLAQARGMALANLEDQALK